MTPAFAQSVTFPAGIESISVPVPLAQLASPTGNTQLGLIIQGGGPQVFGMNQQIHVVSSPDAIPPTITDVHTIQTGHKITGISMTFSKAMDPVTVQDVRDYRLALNFGARSRAIALKSAQYDPATDTVILTTRGPLNPSATYQIGEPKWIGFNGAEMLVDLQGNALNETYGGAGGVPGAFSITVGAKHPYSTSCARSLGRELIRVATSTSSDAVSLRRPDAGLEELETGLTTASRSTTRPSPRCFTISLALYGPNRPWSERIEPLSRTYLGRK